MAVILGVAAVESSVYPPFGKQTFYFEEMIDATSNGSIEILFFSPLNWQKTTNLCKGYRYKNNQWSSVVFELPHLIYDRTFGGFPILHEFQAYLHEQKYSVLNPLPLAAFLANKIKFHHFLLEHHLPTLNALSLDALTEQFFQEEQASYFLKPIFGKGGEGIGLLEKSKDNFILKKDAKHSIVFKNYELLFNYLKKHLLHKNYLIQPQAKLSYFNDRPFDIRVLVQNNSVNNYLITGYGVRVGKEKSFVSNLNTGGTVYPIEALDEHYSKYHNKKLSEEMNTLLRLCRQCCEALHNKYGNFLEIGFDILLTLDKGPIILEANSKPSRWLFNVLAEYYQEEEPAYFFQQLRKKAVSAPIVFTLNNYFI